MIKHHDIDEILDDGNHRYDTCLTHRGGEDNHPLSVIYARRGGGKLVRQVLHLFIVIYLVHISVSYLPADHKLICRVMSTSQVPIALLYAWQCALHRLSRRGQPRRACDTCMYASYSPSVSVSSTYGGQSPIMQYPHPPHAIQERSSISRHSS